jgi:dolichyl-phosphate beta-glucosyltransferase
VNDGSTDRTEQLIEGFKAECPVRCISYTPNKGKGAAVRMGMLSITNDYGLMLDVDMSTPLDEIEKFLPFMKEGSPVLIASRKDASARVLRHQSLIREKLGDLYAVIARWITGVPIVDFSCGCKCFSYNTIQSCFKKSVIDRWCFDVEILSLVHRAGIPIKSIGITWMNDTRSHVRILRDLPRTLIDLVRIRAQY